MKDNFFMVARKATIRRLYDFIRENGYKETCPKCANILTLENFTAKCDNCGYLSPMLNSNKIVGLFVYQTGATRKTVKNYLDDLEMAGKIEYVSEKDTYTAL